MFGSALDKVAGYLDKRLVLTVLFPLLAFGVCSLALVLAHYGWAGPLQWWKGLQAEQRLVFSIGAVAGVVFISSLISAQLGTLTRWYEGYWQRWPGTWLATVGRSLQRSRHRNLRIADDRDFEVRYRQFPRKEEDLLPTRLGNVLKAAELYPSDEGRYGIDAVFFWPRVYPLLPEHFRQSLGEARASLDLMLVTSFLAMLFALGAAVFLALVGGECETWFAALGSGLLVAWLAYRGAVRAAVVFGELVRAAFDLYRGALLKQLGFARPTSLKDEQSLWRAVGQQLYRRETDDSERLVYVRETKADNESPSADG